MYIIQKNKEKNGKGVLYMIGGSIYRIRSNYSNVYAIVIAYNNSGLFYYVLNDVPYSFNNEINEYIDAMRTCDKDDFLSSDFHLLNPNESTNHCFDGYLGRISFENLRYLQKQFKKTNVYHRYF